MPNLIQDIVRHRILNKQRLLTVSNTAAETTLWTYTVPPDTLKQRNALHVRLIGYVFANTGGSDEGLAFKWFFGATTLFHDPTASIITHATRRNALDCDVVLAADNATNVQVFGGHMLLSASNAVGYNTVTGHGDISTPESFFYSPINGVVSTEDTTVSKALRIAVICENADVNMQVVIKYGYVELISF